jgi:hypothetical protein
VPQAFGQLRPIVLVPSSSVKRRSLDEKSTQFVAHERHGIVLQEVQRESYILERALRAHEVHQTLQSSDADVDELT